ncbi:MAG: response regulator transcription factor [Candidatus Kapaibacteriales bacterium]
MLEFTPENPLTMILADDHEVIRTGIKRMLSIDKSIDVLDDLKNGEQAVEAVQKYNPDLALLDIQMPRMDGIEALKKIKEINKGTYVVIFTAFEDKTHLEKAMSAGADGYLAKDIGPKELIHSLKSVVSGERIFSKSIVKMIQDGYSPAKEDNDKIIAVTKREQGILNLIATGKTSNEIAEVLGISVRTVESHRYNLMNKLDMKTGAGLIRYAVLNSTEEIL